LLEDSLYTLFSRDLGHRLRPLFAVLDSDSTQST